MFVLTALKQWTVNSKYLYKTLKISACHFDFLCCIYPTFKVVQGMIILLTKCFEHWKTVKSDYHHADEFMILLL